MNKEKILNFGMVIIIVIIGITIAFKTNTYSLIFVSDNEIFKKIEIRKNTTLKEIEKPEKEGYTFIGWYDKDDNILNKNEKIKENKTYYAHWAKIITEEE